MRGTSERRPELVHMAMAENDEHRALHYAVLDRSLKMVPCTDGARLMRRREVLLLSGAAGLAAQVKKRLSIATAASGGVFYPLGGAIAALLTRYLSGIEVTAEMTGGVTDNLRLLDAGKVALALVVSSAAWDAHEGRLRGLPRRMAVRCLAALDDAQMHVVVLKGSGLKSIADLKGKRVSTGSPGGNDLWQRVLEAYALTPRDFKAHERLGIAEAAGAMKDRKIDALFWLGSQPVPAIVDLAATPGIQIELLPSGEAVSRIIAKHGPACIPGTIPRGVYKGIETGLPVVASRSLLVAHERLEEPLAHQITRTLLERAAELGAMNRNARHLSLSGAVTGSPVPFHPGATRYFKEKGLV